MDEREQTLSAEIKRWHTETVTAFSERREQLEAIRKDAEGAFKEHADSVAATAASFRSDVRWGGKFEISVRIFGAVTPQKLKFNFYEIPIKPKNFMRQNITLRIASYFTEFSACLVA